MDRNGKQETVSERSGKDECLVLRIGMTVMYSKNHMNIKHTGKIRFALVMLLKKVY